MQDAQMPVVYTVHPEMAAALRNLYAVRSPRPPEHRLDYWIDGLWSPEWDRTVREEWSGRRVAIWEIDEDVFRAIGANAVVHDPSCVEATQYFLPRLFDAACRWHTDDFERTDWSPPLELDALAGALSKHDLSAWPPKLVSAIQEVGATLWRYAKFEQTGGFSVLGPLLAAGVPFASLLAAWKTWPEEERADRLAWACAECDPPDRWGSFLGEIGVPASERAAAFRWMSSPESLDLRRSRFFAATTDPSREWWSRAEEIASSVTLEER